MKNINVVKVARTMPPAPKKRSYFYFFEIKKYLVLKVLKIHNKTYVNKILFPFQVHVSKKDEELKVFFTDITWVIIIMFY